MQENKITYNFEEVIIDSSNKSRGPGITIYKNAVCFTKTASKWLKDKSVKTITYSLDTENKAVLFKKNETNGKNLFNLTWSKNNEYATIRNKTLAEDIRKRFHIAQKKSYLKSSSCMWSDDYNGIVVILPMPIETKEYIG